MTNKTKHTLGVAIGILGLVLLLISALDYLMGWNQISSAISAIGILLALAGLGVRKRSMEDQEKREPGNPTG